MHFNTKYIFKGDTEKEIIGKINYNFDQVLSFAVGPDGHSGPMGATGIFGPAGRRGAAGITGTRSSIWYKQITEPLGNNNTNDIWIDSSVSDGNIKVFNYPLANNQWQDSGYSFLNSQYFKSYSYIQGPGGANDKYAIGFKFPGGITGSANTSLLINDSSSSSIGSNPNNSKVVVSTLDQIDRPIMTFAKIGAISDNVPSFYWNSIGSNTGLKFDSGGSFYVTTNLDFSIDSDLARTLISSDSCNFQSSNGTFSIDGDGDFHLRSNISVGVGGLLNISSSNLGISASSFIYVGTVTITSPLTSTYILTSNPSSASYSGGISAKVTSSVSESFNFSDYTGYPILSNKPSGSVSSGSFAQTIFGSTGGLTGGTGGPFSYHVKKVKDVRQATTTLNARKYLTTTTTNLLNVLDISSNTNWYNENIIATPTTYSNVTNDNIASYKVGTADVDLNYKSSVATLYGSGFKNGLTGFDQFNGLVTDFYRLSDGSTIFVGNFKYYNEQPIKNGTLNNVLGICKVNADGTLNTSFRTNIYNSLTVQANGGSVNGILVDENVSLKIFVYGAFSYTVSGGATRVGIVSFDFGGNIDTTFNTNMGTGFTSGTGVNQAILDEIDSTIVAVGNFTSYNGATKYKLIKIKYIGTATNGTGRGSRLTTFLPLTNDGFNPPTAIPACLDQLPNGNIIIGGNFIGYSYAGVTYSPIHIIEINKTNGSRITSNGITGMSHPLTSPSDSIITAIKSVMDFGSTSKIYIGGSFININGYAYSRIAKISTTSTVGGNFTLDLGYSPGTGFDDIIYDFVHDPVTNSSLYVGGRFTTFRGTQSPGFIRLTYDGAIDTTASINHNVISPKTVQSSYEYTLGLVRKIDVNSTDNEFLYAGGFLNTVFPVAGAGGGVYLRLPSSISTDGYIPVYTDNTTTNYRVFLNDIGNNAKSNYIRGIIFDAGLPTAVTSYVDFSATGVTGCQYVDLMWVSKSSTARTSPRLFYKNCQGVSGYVDFGASGVYSVAGTTTINTGQSISVKWGFSKQQTGGFTLYKNGTALSNQVLSRPISGTGILAYDVGDKIYASVFSGGLLSGYVGSYAELIISKISLTGGGTTVLFSNSVNSEAGIVNNFSNPVTIESGYNYTVSGTASSVSSGGGGGCCFVGDTKITMADGSIKNIEDVIAGDLVLTYDPVTLLIKKPSEVTSIESPIKDDIIEFILSSGTTIEATTEHPFWVIGKGWASYSPERTMLDHKMDVVKIEKDDILLDVEGNHVILLDMKDNNTEFKKVYNILMSEGYHTYYANGILVHNKIVETIAGGGGGAS